MWQFEAVAMVLCRYIYNIINGVNGIQLWGCKAVEYYRGSQAHLPFLTHYHTRPAYIGVMKIIIIYTILQRYVFLNLIGRTIEPFWN